MRTALENLLSGRMADGIRTGLFNSRGAHWRGEGGDQERALAAKFGRWEQALRYTHPKVARVMNDMVRTYTHDAHREDLEATLRLRLQR